MARVSVILWVLDLLALPIVFAIASFHKRAEPRKSLYRFLAVLLGTFLGLVGLGYINAYFMENKDPFYGFPFIPQVGGFIIIAMLVLLVIISVIKNRTS